MATTGSPDAPAARRPRKATVFVVPALLAGALLYGTSVVWASATDRSWAGDRCKAAAMDLDAARAAADPAAPVGDLSGTLDVRLEWTPLPTWRCDIGWSDGTSRTVDLGRRLDFF